MTSQLSEDAEALLRRALAGIEANPESWSQQVWLCGTQACLAGWVVAAAEGLSIVDLDRGPSLIPFQARRLLGLSPPQASELFYFTFVRLAGSIYREPTFADLCDRVFEVTGVRHHPQGASGAG